MLERADSFVDHKKVADVLTVVLPNGLILGAINLADVDHAISIAAGAATLIYAVFRFFRDRRAGK